MNIVVKCSIMKIYVLIIQGWADKTGPCYDIAECYDNDLKQTSNYLKNKTRKTLLIANIIIAFSRKKKEKKIPYIICSRNHMRWGRFYLPKLVSLGLESSYKL